jgi:tetratricopeptide (TPR) repeat protein
MQTSHVTARRNAPLALSLLGLIALLAWPALPLAAAPSDAADVTIAAAQRAAREDRNAVSVKLFEEAIAVAPQRRLELLPDLADQLTYSGRAADAIPLYRESIGSGTLSASRLRHVELGLALALSWDHRLSQSLATYGAVLVRDPHDVEALLGQARVLSWQDQLSPSLRVYRRVIALDPENKEALEGIARVQDWRGRKRDSQKVARAILSRYTDDKEATLTLAQSELWMGRPDAAAREDEAFLRTHPTDSGALALANDIADSRRTQAQLSVNDGTQSDGLLIRSGTLDLDVASEQGLASVGVRYQPITYVGAGSAGDAEEKRAGVVFKNRFNDWAELDAAVSNDDITSTGATEKNLLLYNAYATLYPNDTLTFYLGSRKETFDNLTSLRMGLSAVFNSFSLDVTPDENTRISARGYLGSFSDGNREGWEQLEFERAVVRRPRLSFGARATSYSFAESPGNGYYDPPRYQSLEMTTHIYGNLRDRIYYDGAASYGREWAVDGGTRPTHSLHGALSYVISKPLSLSALYDNFDTRQISNGGFARTVLGLRLQSRW